MRIVTAFLLILTAWSTNALAQYPTRTITLVVPFAAGGPTDVLARTLGVSMGKTLGQTVVIENKLGAGGTIGANYVAKAAPDGYTLVLANVGALAVNPHILKTPYDPLRDLVPISMAAEFANVLVVQPSLGLNTVADFVNIARAKPAIITYASSGIGGAGHLSGELLRRVANIDIVHVPYKGGGPAMQGFLGAQVDSFFATPISSISQIRAGRAKALATTGSRRAALMPDVPTIAESGYPGYEALNWYGFLGPRGLPKEMVERLNKEFVKALANPQVVAALHKTGTEPKSSTPEEFAAYIKREYDTWGKVVKEAGIKAQ
jgi:tripartite-type tricarboxylate transporter receptor subunit TctC